MIQRLNLTAAALLLSSLGAGAAATVQGYLVDGSGNPNNQPITFTLTYTNVLASSNAIVGVWTVVALPQNGFFSTNLVAGNWTATTPLLPFPVTGIQVPNTNGVFDWLSLTTNVYVYAPTNFGRLPSQIISAGTNVVLSTNNAGLANESVSVNVGTKIGLGTNSPQYNLDVVYDNSNGAGLNAVRVLTTGAAGTAELRLENDQGYVGRHQKLGSSASPYAIFNANDTTIYNSSGGGNISLLNDYVNGAIQFSVVSSTPALKIDSNNVVGFFTATNVVGSSVKGQLKILVGGNTYYVDLKQ